MEDLIFYGVQLLIAVIAFLLGKFLFPKLKMLQENETGFFSTILNWVYSFVIDAKNSLQGQEGEEKKAWVTDKIKALCVKWEINLTEDQISALIELAYDMMVNNEAPTELPEIIGEIEEDEEDVQ